MSSAEINSLLYFYTGAIVEVSKDESDTLSSVYFQTQGWKNTYARYPELVLIDATYKLKNFRMPLYIMMVVDGNGESGVIALWLVVHEDKMTISHLMMYSLSTMIRPIQDALWQTKILQKEMHLHRRSPVLN